MVSLILGLGCGERELARQERSLVDRYSSQWDWDADGYPDMLVGANGAGVYTTQRLVSDTGRVYLIRGSAQGPVLTDTVGIGPDWALEHGDNFGLAIDVGHFSDAASGQGDFVVGAPGREGAQGRQEGRVYTYRGVDRDLSAFQELAPMTDGQQDQLFGAAVALGDFDGDGRDDLAVGAPGDAAPGRTVSSAGTVHLFQASERGHYPAWSWRSPVLDQSRDIPQSGNNFGDKFGHALAAGDFNCDGFEDLAVSAPGFNEDSGRVIIFEGGSHGLTEAQVLTAADFSVSPLRSDYFGLALAVGDLFGDGDCRDLAVAAPNMGANGRPRQGTVFIYRRDSSGLVAHQQLELDAMVDRFDGANFGASMAFGDLNGDGHEELMIGAPGYKNVGAAFYYLTEDFWTLGGPSGTQLVQSWELRPRLLLDKAGFGRAREAGDVFGAAIAAADFDGDRLATFAVGAPGDLRNSVVSGSVYFYESRHLTSVLQPDGWTVSAQGVEGERFGGSMMASGRYIRRVVIEEDYLDDCFVDTYVSRFGPTARSGSPRVFSAESVFYAGGILADVWVDGPAPNPAPGTNLNNAQIHQTMEESKNPDLMGAGDRWSSYLLYINQGCVGGRAIGQMFDHGPNDLNGIPREGAWVIGDILHATHEIAHTFNLHHDEYSVLRSVPGDVWSCSNHPHDCPSLMQPTSSGHLFLSKKSKAHLMNHPDRYVRPGWAQGVEFSEDGCIDRHLRLH